MVLLATLSLVPAARAQQLPDFSGQWILNSNQRNVTVVISHHDPLFNVETTIARGSDPPRHAVQRYTIDGKISISTGADGDEFHTSIVWRGQSLVFTIMEYEDQRMLPSKETWSLIENGAVLQRLREKPGGKNQTLKYLRQP